MVEEGAVMNGLYLSRIELENFRTFGSFALDLPAAPGLTLLVGMNGLGKSSFFDGLEWCLTDQIRRFADHLTSSITEKDYLTRREAPQNSHKASMTFNRGKPLTRTATLRPDPKEVIELLKADKWGPIDDLGTYLAFTHFLGQAAQQRFTSRKRNEQWQSLKGPSGIDRLEEVRSALRGAPTTNAFTKRLSEQQGIVHVLEGSLAEWREATARLARLRQVADAKGDLSGPSLESHIAALETRLARITGVSSETEGKSVNDRIVALRVDITNQTSEVSRLQAALLPFSSMIERYLAAKGASDPEGTLLTEAEDAVNAANSAVASAEQARAVVQTRSQQQAAQLTELEAKVAALIAARQSLEQIATIEAQKQSADLELDVLNRESESKQRVISQADATIAAQRDRQTNLAALNVAAITAKSLSDRAGELVQLEAELRIKTTASVASESAALEARARVPSLLLEEIRVRADIEDSSRRIDEARRRASDLAAAVAHIAGHLEDHDQTCPVCSTVFEPGALKLLATSAAAAQDAVLAPLEATQATLVAKAAQINTDLATFKILIDAADTASFEANSVRANVDELRKGIASSLDVDIPDDFAAIAIARHAEAGNAVTSLIATIEANAPDTASAETGKAFATAEIEDLRRRLDELTRSIVSFDVALREHREALAASGHLEETVEALNNRIRESNDTVEDTRRAKGETDAELAAASVAETGARRRLAAAQGELSRVKLAIDAARSDMEALEAQWTKADLPADPAVASLELKRGELERDQAELATLLNYQAEVVAMSEAAVRHQDLSELTTWMEQQAGEGAADNPGAHEQRLVQQHADAVTQRALTESARMAVNAYTERLKKEAEDFSTQFLVPLNDLIDNYNRALLSTPGESVRLNASHNVNRTQFDMGMRYGDQLDEALYNTKLPPQIVLSEGQMAANGFSILCAASTAYPWSNWRALLLDDPLQHNDIIHAAAFVDVMRNLVELQHYQLLMSSHDRAEGEFFARKFDAAGLPCTVLALTAPSKDGVRFEPPRYNAAARALMNLESAQLG